MHNLSGRLELQKKKIKTQHQSCNLRNIIKVKCCKKIEKNVSKFVERGIKIFAAVYTTNDFMLA